MKVKDRSGYVVFSEGEFGAAHVMAHELCDAGQVELGHARLGRWLTGRTGSGSDWAHIQFHMAVFELAVGDWKAAYDRFLEELLPIAATSHDALTDAPALAWRLQLRGGNRAVLPWETLRQSALPSLDSSADPFVELHDLLALAGARDLDGIAAWREARLDGPRSTSSGILVRMADALGAYAQKHYRRAADLLGGVLAALPSIGGSGAQNELFREMQARFAAA
jgi:hypothetical protein